MYPDTIGMHCRPFKRELFFQGSSQEGFAAESSIFNSDEMLIPDSSRDLFQGKMKIEKSDPKSLIKCNEPDAPSRKEGSPMYARKLLVVVGVFLLASASAVAYVARAQSSSQRSPQSSAKTAGEKVAEAQTPEKDANYFLLTGTAVHEDGSAWEGMEVVLFFLDKRKTSSVFYAADSEGLVKLTNPRAKTDAKGQFAIKVHRGYLQKDAEETEFRIGRLEPVRGTLNLVEMKRKISKGPLTLKVKKNVESTDLGEIW
jgi:hypothetical protein